MKVCGIYEGVVCTGQKGHMGGGGGCKMELVSCPDPPTKRSRKGLVKGVALACPKGMQ